MIGALAIKTRRQQQMQKSRSTTSYAESVSSSAPIMMHAASSQAGDGSDMARKGRHCSLIYLLSGILLITGFVMILPGIVEVNRKYFIMSGALMGTGVLVLLIGCCCSEFYYGSFSGSGGSSSSGRTSAEGAARSGRAGRSGDLESGRRASGVAGVRAAALAPLHSMRKRMQLSPVSRSRSPVHGDGESHASGDSHLTRGRSEDRNELPTSRSPSPMQQLQVSPEYLATAPSQVRIASSAHPSTQSGQQLPLQTTSGSLAARLKEEGSSFSRQASLEEALTRSVAGGSSSCYYLSHNT